MERRRTTATGTSTITTTTTTTTTTTARRQKPQTRSHHRKVRTGCDQCKKSRVKCDEAEPRCQLCVRRELECSRNKVPRTWLFERGPSASTPSSSSRVKDGGRGAGVVATHVGLVHRVVKTEPGVEKSLQMIEQAPPVTMMKASLLSSKSSIVSDEEKEVEIGEDEHWNGPVVGSHCSDVYNMLTVNSLAPESSYPSVRYLKSVYKYDASRIANIFSFTFLVYGPNFVWRLHTDHKELNDFTPRFVHYCLWEPALLESIFSAAEMQMSTISDDSENPTQNALQHHCLALRLLQNRVSSPAAAHDDSLFWAIIATLVFSQEQEDWVGFDANWKGLKLLVDLRGGREVLNRACSRQRKFYDWAESLQRSTTSRASTESPSNTSEMASSHFLLQDCGSTVPPRNLDGPYPRMTLEEYMSSPFIPSGFRKATIASESTYPPPHIRCLTLHLVLRTTRWYQGYQPGECDELAGETMHDLRVRLAQDLHFAMTTLGLRVTERLVCLGLFVLVISLPPSYLAEDFPITLADVIRPFEDMGFGPSPSSSSSSPSPSSFSSTPGSSAVGGDDDEEQNREMRDGVVSTPLFLWIALVVASVNVCFGLRPRSRWFLLDAYMKRRMGEEKLQWGDVKGEVDGFLCPGFLVEQWGKCWMIAQKRVAGRRRR
ncbi:hypothetical protein BU24DRAFT_85911 [Aaosphaeria arxii CBS 175.79]|uniref:Zn(2)-C6 fungal-type domain-containing protein n=1 Tax=Aaosphaeria arxii CBS 175.79 TaxID=1450172 RepID=A0A6A5X8X4_9PLEO|nr:uncharacterized protein BU24DRAFT_85911 [Aaosphaeria arxii CBS 175.79]KAF2009257.1 hypothetical protein BU24DRAFT_85911 [Aaosphaeria arxii CBS 175.79]